MGRKKAIVTGGEIGMGRGISLVLAKEGYDIAFSYYPKMQNSELAIERTQKMLAERGAKSWCFPADFSKPHSTKIFFDQAVEALGGLDLLVNDAGVNKPQPIQDVTEETVDYLVQLDFKTYILMMHHATRYMIDHGIHGNIVNVSSSRAERSYPNAGIYCGMKAGINRMTEAFALDVCDYGIRINNVAPGAIRVRTDEELLEIPQGTDTDYFWDQQYLTTPDKVVGHDFWDQLAPRIPLKRAGLPEDIGNAVAFLASDKASYITGFTLRVDGGLILPGMPEDPGYTGSWK